MSDGHITRLLIQHLRELCDIEFLKSRAELKVDLAALDRADLDIDVREVLFGQVHDCQSQVQEDGLLNEIRIASQHVALDIGK